MLKLERVEIQGFKSFYEKVDLAFPGSVTAVVGPNGCGKSNICDAVAWALGEQSARILRGERMDDVIFNGSAKRRPLGMAEVTLTLSRRGGLAGTGEENGENGGNGNGAGNGHGPENGNGRQEPGSESDTLRIGRRVYREGQGEYFLNDKQVRLKDIQDQLLGTGLGVRAYSVIEQGRIDQVLSTKPQDRRRLIEEAAGITRYKLKKRLAETKLEETRGNLLRLSDILSEIERNVTSLKRQASRAARYKEKSAELRQKRASLVRAGHDRLSATEAQARRESGARRDREAESSAALARAEAELVSARLAASEAVGERDRLRELVLSLESAIQRDDALLEGNRRAVQDLSSRRAALEREGRDVTSERERNERELADLNERLERAIADARSRSLAREEADRRATAAGAALAALERDLEAVRAEALAAAGDSVAARNARHEVDLQASRVAASLSRLREALDKVVQETRERHEEVVQAEKETADAGSNEREARAAVASEEAELERLAALLMHKQSERDEARERLGEAEHRQGALSEVLRRRESNVQSVRDSFARAGVPERGRLSDRLRPRRGWEEAVDVLLGEELDALLAAGDPRTAAAAARDLPSASFIRADWSAATASGQEGVKGWEVALENFRELGAAEQAALPTAAFLDSLDEALLLAERFPTIPIVTRSRELLRGSLVKVFRVAPEAEGLFALRRELEDLEGRIGQEREGVAGFDHSLEDLRRQKTEREGRLPELRERERRANTALSGVSARAEERRAESIRLDRERDTLSAESATLADEAAGLASLRNEIESEERRHAAREEQVRARAEQLSAALPEARSFAAAAGEDLAHRRTEAEVAAERRRSLDAARERVLEMSVQLNRRVGEGAQEERRLAERSAELAREETEARQRQEANLRAREQHAEEREAAAVAAAEAIARAERGEEGTRAARSVLDAAREARFEAEMAETKVHSDLDHLTTQAREEFGLEPGELPPPADVSDEALALLETEAAELAAAIERIGPVNVLAFEEYEEETKRSTFLTAQRDDLLRSIAELQDSIRKINATSSERFREAFQAINENFVAMFSRLFQGGTAQMRLLDENDLLESGVEISAQPPGKRNQSILLLSGGEKALTAIALLMAIFRYKPSPFCILDEVDAPLDEANIDRFTRLLRDMTEETQFIAITHNKRTMETADVMYGVTMEEPGCSKIVSVRFD